MKEFLKEHEIDINQFIITEKDITDILILGKKFTQKVSFEVVQRDMLEQEALEEIKKEIPRITRFKAEDYPIWVHTIRGVEPGTFKVDDCITCDGHWEITCNTCGGITEIKCKKCEGRGQLIEEKIIHDKVPSTCQTCNWKGRAIVRCNVCNWAGNIVKRNPCMTCNWKGSIQTPQGLQVCSVCKGARVIQQTLACSVCNGSGKKEIICNTCKGSGTTIMVKQRKERFSKRCNYCNWQGRRSCPTCNWMGSIVCPTCKGDRRTTQYEYNTFKIEVRPNYELIIATELNVDAIEAIAKAPLKKVEYLLKGEKEKLQKKLLEKKMKLSEKTTTRVKGKLYTLESKLTKDKYYIFKSNNSFYLKKLPPKSNIDTYKEHYLKKWKNIANKLYTKVWRKIENSITWKNEY